MTGGALLSSWWWLTVLSVAGRLSFLDSVEAVRVIDEGTGRNFVLRVTPGRNMILEEWLVRCKFNCGGIAEQTVPDGATTLVIPQPDNIDLKFTVKFEFVITFRDAAPVTTTLWAMPAPPDILNASLVFDDSGTVEAQWSIQGNFVIGYSAHYAHITLHCISEITCRENVSQSVRTGNSHKFMNLAQGEKYQLSVILRLGPKTSNLVTSNQVALPISVRVIGQDYFTPQSHNSLNVSWYYYGVYNISLCTLKINDEERNLTNPDVHHRLVISGGVYNLYFTNVELSPLTQDTKYAVSVACCREFEGRCPFGKIKHKDIYTRVAPLSSVALENFTDVSAEISWTLPRDIRPYQPISVYVNAPTPGISQPETTIWANRSGVSITRLKSETRYTVNMTIQSALINGSDSKTMEYYVVVGRCVPAGVALRELAQIRDGTTPESVRLGWSYDEGNISGSKCEITIIDQLIQYDSKGLEGRQGRNHSKLVSDLTPDAQYNIGIRCCTIPEELCSEMDGLVLLDKCFSDQAYHEMDQVFTLPGTVSNIRVVSRGSDSAQIAWSLPEGATQNIPLSLTLTPNSTAQPWHLLWENRTGMDIYGMDGELTYEMSIRVGTRHPYIRYGSESHSNIYGALRSLQFMIGEYQADEGDAVIDGGLPDFALAIIIITIVIGFICTAFLVIYRFYKLKRRVGMLPGSSGAVSPH